MSISFDVAVDGSGSAATTSLTWNHTCASTATFLVVGVYTTANILSGVTYNGVSMTLLTNFNAASGLWVNCYYLLNPATGSSHAIVVSGSNGFMAGVSSSYIGVGGKDNSGASNGTTSPLANTIISVADNCWHVVVGISSSGNAGAGTSTTQRVQNSFTGGLVFLDNNGVIHPAGSNTVNTTSSNPGPGVGALGMTLFPAVENFSDTFTLTEGFNKNITQKPSETFSLTEGFSKTLGIPKNFVESLTLIEKFKLFINGSSVIWSTQIKHFPSSWTTSSQHSSSWTTQPHD